MVRVAIADDNKEISHHIEEVVRKEAEKLKELIIAPSCGYLIQNITSEKA